MKPVHKRAVRDYEVVISPPGRIRVHRAGELERDERFFASARERIERAFGCNLPPELLDLLDLAHAVHLTDRLARRRIRGTMGDELNWVRNINVSLRVRRPDIWNSPAVQDRLSEALTLLTDDRWNLHFQERRFDPSAKERQGHLFSLRPSQPITTALFSGGLDSLAGLGIQLADRRSDHFVTVSAASTSRLVPVQRGLIQALRARFGLRITHVRTRFGFVHRNGSYDHDETSQRTRGFMFMTLGAAAATAAGCDTLTLYENGIGSLNLPISKGQFGSQATRSTDPRVLLAMGQLVALLLDRPFRVVNPFVLQTKGEMCAVLSAIGIDDLAAQTISCDGYPQRSAGAAQCGSCTSCLLRRLSLQVAGLQRHDPGHLYRRDTLTAADQLSDEHSGPWRVTLAHVSAVRRALSSADPWGNFIRLHPELIEIVRAIPTVTETAADVPQQLTRLYRRYCDEWDAFPSAPPGWRRHAA